MTIPAAFAPAIPTIGGILAAMGVVAAIETVIPLHARGRWHRAHLAPNLALTFLTFATNFFLNAGVLAAVLRLQGRGFGLLPALSLPPFVEGGIAVALLDFSFYLAHVLMHKIPSWWRYHSVHHSDPAVDVTTTVRQHPIESGIRYAFIAAFALALVPSPAAFGIYRVWSALNGLLEHSNIRLPPWLDRLLSLVTTWPNTHKVHHSRIAAQTDTNYGNLFSVWDRLFGTFTPSRVGANVAYGLEGFDDPETQRIAGLLTLPWRERRGVAHGSEAPAAVPQLHGCSAVAAAEHVSERRIGPEGIPCDGCVSRIGSDA